MIAARADIFLIALAEKLATEHGGCFDLHNITVKKTAYASAQPRPDFTELREA